MLASRTVHATMDDRASAFAALLDRGLETHYRLAAVILGDPIEAEDAVHDAAVVAWRGFAGLRDRDRFEAWFGRILVNGCRDRLRARRRRPIIVAIPALGTTDAGLPMLSGPDAGIALATRDELERAFARLEPEQAIVVALRYYADLTVPQIAARLRHRRGHREIPPAPRAPTTANDGRAPRGDRAMTDDRFEQQLRGFLAAREPAAVSPVLRARLQSVTAESPVRSGGWIGWLGGAWRAAVGLAAVAAVAAVAVVLLAVLLRTDALTVREPGPVGRPSAIPGLATVPFVTAPAGLFTPETVADAERRLAAVFAATGVEATFLVQAATSTRRFRPRKAGQTDSIGTVTRTATSWRSSG